ncbi:hypothetical protein [Sphingomonas sp. dw_22]|nr:hypothetical protein [Sphingomonas sp. dw_22]
MKHAYNLERPARARRFLVDPNSTTLIAAAADKRPVGAHPRVSFI